ncbi:MAG: glycosyltransferase family 4 protein [Bacteroidaceae bacterium]
MKLTLASRGSSDNPKAWSGTPHALKEEFSKHEDIELKCINWEMNKWILRIYHFIFRPYFFLYNSCREKWLRPFARYKVNTTLTSKRDFTLFISDFILPKEKRKSLFAVYTDSHVSQYINYCKEDTRIGRKYFLKDYNRITKAQLEQMNIVFTQNEWTRQGFIKDYNLSPDKVINIGFGINVKPYEGPKDYEKELLLIVLRKGTEYYKGLYLLLDAFKIVRSHRQQVRLAVVGTTMKETIDGVDFYDNYPRTKTVELFQQCTLYTMPSLHEPNGITYLEALANKAPIMGLNRFAVPEFSGYGKWGFIAENENPTEIAQVIEDALSDKNRLKEMGLKGQKFVINHYRWNIVVDKMIKEMRKSMNLNQI